MHQKLFLLPFYLLAPLSQIIFFGVFQIFALSSAARCRASSIYDFPKAPPPPLVKYWCPANDIRSVLQRNDASRSLVPPPPPPRSCGVVTPYALFIMVCGLVFLFFCFCWGFSHLPLYISLSSSSSVVSFRCLSWRTHCIRTHTHTYDARDNRQVVLKCRRNYVRILGKRPERGKKLVETFFLWERWIDGLMDG